MLKSRSIVTDSARVRVDSDAARCLKAALETLKREKKISLREVARRLNYKQPVTLSQMANGRMPIPVERAEEIALATGINPSKFINLVLKQRYPDMNLSVCDQSVIGIGLSNNDEASFRELSDWPSLTASQKRVIREVLRDERAEDRWLSPHEVASIQLLRKLRSDLPFDGLTDIDMEKVRHALG